MKNILTIALAALLLTGCWHDDEAYELRYTRPQYAAFQEVQNAWGLLADTLFSLRSTGDTTLTGARLESAKYYYGYDHQLTDVRVTWGEDEMVLSGKGTVSSQEDKPLTVDYEVLQPVVFRVSRDWGYAIYDDLRTNACSGRVRMSVRSSDGIAGTSFTAVIGGSYITISTGQYVEDWTVSGY